MFVSSPNHNLRNNFWTKLAFVLIFISTLAFFVNLKPRIMVIHSASENDTRVQEMNAGIQRFFAKNHRASLSYQYLDVQPNTSEIYKLKAGVLARQTIDRLNPTLMIICDRPAQELVGRNYINTSDKNIIFCGITNNSQDFGYEEAQNVSSVFDSLPLNAIREILPLLTTKTAFFQNPIKIVFLGDNSEKTKNIRQALMAYDWTPYRLIDIIGVNTFEEWKSAVTASTSKADVILVGGYTRIFQDEAQTLIKNPRELVKWTVNSTSLPVLGTTHTFFSDGGDMAVTSSAFSQGEEAAKLAYQILNGKSARDLSITPQDYLIYLKEEPVNKNIANLPSLYKTFSRALNHYENLK